jgi:hypothetical protein
VASWVNCFPDFAGLQLARAEAKGAQEKQQFRNCIEGQIEDALEQSGLLDGIVEQFTTAYENAQIVPVLTWDRAEAQIELEEHLVNSLADPLRHVPLKTLHLRMPVLKVVEKD